MIGRGLGQGLAGRMGDQFGRGDFPGGYGPGRFGGPGLLLGHQLFGMVLGLIVVGLVVFAFWKLFQKAGFNGALGLLMLVPGVNLAAMLFLAFAEWPALRELEQLRAWRIALASGTVAAPAPVAVAGTMDAAAPPVEPPTA